MSHNNSVTINECITNLMTLDDFNSNLDSLKHFFKNTDLNEEDKETLKKIINLMTMKNTRMKSVVNQVANSLNKTQYY